MDNQNDKNGHEETVVDGIFSSNRKSAVAVSRPVVPAPDSEVYKKHERKGTAVIFNHKNFTMNCPIREGTDRDRDALQDVLTELTFDVKAFDDLTYEEIVDVLNVVSRMDHSESECLVIAVMSHGEEGVLYAKDRPYETKKLWTRFSPLHCPSLAGKPKLFFIQACRGDKSDPGVEVTYVEEDSNKKIKNNVYTIPVMADILIMYATVEEYYAWRDITRGSYFIQALVHQLRQHYRTKDLLSILTCVNRDVAVGFSSSEPNNPEYNNKKEMCSIVSMLTRTYYFNL